MTQNSAGKSGFPWQGAAEGAELLAGFLGALVESILLSTPLVDRGVPEHRQLPWD